MYRDMSLYQSHQSSLSVKRKNYKSRFWLVYHLYNNTALLYMEMEFTSSELQYTQAVNIASVLKVLYKLLGKRLEC